MELNTELNLKKTQLAARETECTNTIKDNKASISLKEAEITQGKNMMDSYFSQINQLKLEMKSSSEQSDKYETQLGMKRTEATKLYNTYWGLTDDHAKVRQVLMQAMWLICYGFRSFRNDEFCVTLRQQPDFNEPQTDQTPVTDSAYATNQAITAAFAQTMEPVWVQQKLADTQLVNTMDGDTAGNKGFVKNRAPLGIDEEAELENLALIQEQMGVKDGKDLGNGEMASRLQNILEASGSPDSVVQPIQGLVIALQDSEGEELSAEARAAAVALVDMLVGIDGQMGTEQAKADEDWYRDWTNNADGSVKLMKLLTTEEDAVQGTTRDAIGRRLTAINNIKQSLKDHETSLKTLASTLRNTELTCKTDYVRLWADIAVTEQEMINTQALNSLLRMLALDQEPVCSASQGVLCDNPNRGFCTWKTRGETTDPNHQAAGDESAVFCSCEDNWYGPNCALQKCPGLGKILYKQTQTGVCSNRGGSCDDIFCGGGTASTGCSDTGQCTCNANYAGTSCEQKKCKNDAGAVDMTCSGHGTCDTQNGNCVCQEGWYGATWGGCSKKKCPGAVGSFRAGNPLACNGNGACRDDGTCACSGASGEKCDVLQCDNNCGGRGTCDGATGRCACTAPYNGGNSCADGKCHHCKYTDCGPCSNGMCDRLVGKCTCLIKTESSLRQVAVPGNFNGPNCMKPCQKSEAIVDWSRSMDKWGWSRCPTGSLLVGLSRDDNSLGKSNDALYRINKAKCRTPCDQTGSEQADVPLTNCYHQNWWKSFDTKGGKFCRRNYFIAGLFRSHCNSLYCLEMVKCCQVKKAVWNDCAWTKMAPWKTAGQFAEVDSGKTDGDQAFIAGFYRSGTHTLDGLEHLRQCVPAWWSLSTSR